MIFFEINSSEISYIITCVSNHWSENRRPKIVKPYEMYNVFLKIKYFDFISYMPRCCSPKWKELNKMKKRSPNFGTKKKIKIPIMTIKMYSKIEQIKNLTLKSSVFFWINWISLAPCTNPKEKIRIKDIIDWFSTLKIVFKTKNIRVEKKWSLYFLRIASKKFVFKSKFYW